MSGLVTKHINCKHVGINLKISDFVVKDDVDYFNNLNKEKLKCNLCNWETTDVKNKSGAFTNHINKSHNLSTGEFIELYGQNYSSLWKISKNNIQRNEYIQSDVNNRIVCKICNESLKILSNSHLKKHNITQSEYKEKYGSVISITTSNLYSKNLSDIEMPSQSSYEIEIVNYIKTIYDGEIITNSKKIIYPFELDIYLPSLKLGIEFNGLYFHSELSSGRGNSYHLSKTLTAMKNNIHLIQIFEDEWKNKKDIIKSMLSAKLNKLTIKLNARDCIIKTVDVKLKNEFLSQNHIQGSDKSAICYGLYFKEELVSLITFGSLRSALGNKSKLNHYELLRFCNKQNINCRGGFSKLFKFFINNHNPHNIITYADRRFSSNLNNVYNTNNLNYIGETKPNYFYMKNHSVRLHRFNFPKHKLVKMGHDSNLTEWEIMQTVGYDRIWDCGHLKFEWKQN